MSRAAVVIGVNRTSSLAELEGAVPDAEAFAAWAHRQDIETTLITDHKKQEVTFTAVFEAVKRIVEARRFGQLIIYFAGHGFQSGGSEVWLLSGAPDNAREAIGLEPSIMAARESGLPSVVFISDACRSIPATPQQSRVDGGSIFPNRIDHTVRPEIDRFFATLPSLVAVEAAQAGDSARRGGIFTREFIRVHHDTPAPFVAYLQENGQRIEVVMNRKLRKLVRDSVEDAAYAVAPAAGQLPDSIIESDAVYVGRVERPGGGGPGSRLDAPIGVDALAPERGDLAPRAPPDVLPRERAAIPSVAAIAREAIVAASEERPAGAPTEVAGGLAQTVGLSDAIRRYRAPTPVDHFESGTGFTVTGTAIADAVSSLFQVDLLTDALVRVWPKHAGVHAGSTVVRFAGGTGTALPALEGYIAHIFVRDGMVTNVNYVPATNSPRWPDYAQAKERVEQLRAAVAAAAGLGVFRIDKSDARWFADRIRVLKAIDPTLGLYAAYAYASGGIDDEVRSVRGYMGDDLHADLFDVAMLDERDIDAGATGQGRPIVPFCPMLRQGWALIPVRTPKLPGPVLEARNYLLPALWTTFAPEGVSILAEALAGGGLR